MNIMLKRKLLSYGELETFYELPFFELINLAHDVHRQYHNSRDIKLAIALSVKTGRCPEDCAFCPQSAHHNTDIKDVKITSREDIIKFAMSAKQLGIAQICLGAAWRSIPNSEEFDNFVSVIPELNKLDLKVCFSMGMLSYDQAERLKNAGLYEYNHNVDTARSYYSNIIKTRSYEERIKSVDNIIKSGLRLSCGGILGLGESIKQRIEFIHELHHLNVQPTTIPLNTLYPSKGTPLANRTPIDPFEYIRCVALARIAMPSAEIALAAGRNFMSKEMQSLCFYVGATTFYVSEKILVTPSNHPIEEDYKMIRDLSLNIKNN